MNKLPRRWMGTGNGKLSKDDVRKIRKLLAAGKVQKEIAEAFGVTPATISQIKLRRIYAYVED